MKCEMCHAADAETAFATDEDGEETELYVCNACARKARKARQLKSQSTHRLDGSAGDSGEANGGSDGETPFIAALADAVNGIVSELNRVAESAKSEEDSDSAGEADANGPDDEAAFAMRLPPRMPKAYRVGQRIHLEGLFITGDLDAARRAAHAFKMRLDGVGFSSVGECVGHVFAIRQAQKKSTDSDRSFFAALLNAEKRARQRLCSDFPRIYGDAVCRALAILKNCRLLARAEFFDLLSPMRLAAADGLLDGITYAEIDKLMNGIDLTFADEERLEPSDADRLDGECADDVNRLFQNVTLSDRAEKIFQ